MAQSSHPIENVYLKDSESVAKTREDSYDRSDRWDKRKPRPYNKRDRPSWKRTSGFGGGNWRNGRENHRSKPNTNALIRDSTNLREAKPVIFDLSSGRSKMELNDWFKSAAPSKLRREDGVGWIYILSENITNEDKGHLFESYEGIVALRQEWSKINDDPSIEVTFETFKDLAVKHDCKLGKWILTHGGLQIDDIWQNLALAFAYDKFPEGTIALKVSPVDEFEPSGSNNHMIHVINRDMTDENEIILVERAIRNVSIRADLQYKPNIYTELGIYRNNRFGIRPSVYRSMKKTVGGDSGFEITNLAKEEWVYRYNPDPVTADQMIPERDSNIKDGNENMLEDIQAKIELLREALNNVDEAVKSFVKQQGKEKKKKNRGKKGGDVTENVKTKDDQKDNTEEGNALDDNDAIKENVDIAVGIKKMIQDVVAKIDNGNVKVDEVEIKDFYPKNDKVNEGKDSKISKEKIDNKKKSKDKKKAGKKGDGDVDGPNEGVEGDAGGKKVEKKGDGEVDSKNEGVEEDADGKKVEKESDGKNEGKEGDADGRNEGMEGDAVGKKVGKEGDGKNEGMEGDADGKKVRKKSDGDADGKNEDKEGEAITKDYKDLVDEVQA